MSSPVGTTKRAALLAAVLLVGVFAGGCAGDAAPYPPTGIDGLAIPTARPDPHDFVDRVDNPWFPLVPGTRWTYGVPGATAAERTVVVAVPGPTLAGVRTTSMRTTAPPRTAGGRPVVTTDYYAQDRAGDVWWFGRAGEWQVGEGSGAGLAMPAHPRRGDGFAMTGEHRAAGHAPTYRGVVVDTDRPWRSPLGSTHRLVVLEVIGSGVADVAWYAPGLGLVQRGETGLVAFDQPRS